MSSKAFWLLVIAAAVGAGVVHAHHSISMFELAQPAWVKGTVVRYQVIDPHVMIELEEVQANGETRRWIVEGPRPARFDRILALSGSDATRSFLKPGDVISTCGFPLTKAYAPERMYNDWQPESERFIHGHILVMPDGRMQSWGPYGKSDNCVRPADAPATWVEFLNRDRLARDLWCNSRTYSAVPSVASPAFVDEVGRGMKSPCTG